MTWENHLHLSTIPTIIFSEKNYVFIILKIKTLVNAFFSNPFIWVYPKIAVSLQFLLFYPNPKGDKRNYTLVSVQKWDKPIYFE
jgi:hypothetical protein